MKNNQELNSLYGESAKVDLSLYQWKMIVHLLNTLSLNTNDWPINIYELTANCILTQLPSK
jgi:hypothetical protein